ncbi:MAG TPA: GGDEF domain-containing protein [Lachnospiraceae bacterium]|nr:GGDEF domain-containing protein [Lachnospiraceae bacterium]
MGEKYSDGMNYKVIAFVLACYSNDEQLRMMKKVAHECKKHDCKVVFFSTISDLYLNDLLDAGEKKIFDTISVECFDAIVLMSESFKQNEDQIRMIQRAHNAGVLVIAVDKYMEGCINISFHYGDAFREIVKHMIEFHGYRTINFMGGIPGNSYSDERLEVYKEVLKENQIPFDPKRVYYGYFWKDPTVVAMQKMFDDGLPLPEVIICANDAMAITVCTFLQERGYRIPEDIAVSGFDGIEMEKYSRPRMTTGIYNVDGFVDLMFNIVNNHYLADQEGKRIPVYNKMQIGRSCGCAGGGMAHVCSEMVQLKADLQREIKNQVMMSQMVANHGNAERLTDVIHAIPKYMEPLHYKDFWFCANQNLVEEAWYMELLHENEFVANNPNYTRKLSVLHYQKDTDMPVVDYSQKISFGDLIPQRDKQLKENDYLLVLTVHMKGVTAGYAVVSFDIDQFWFSGYSSFITNFKYLMEMQKVQMKLMQFYLCDSLTGLFNRTGFNQKMHAIMDNSQKLDMSVILLDMDGLKNVNDTYGHSEGDNALRALGHIIQNSIDREIAVRIGGDEFLVAFVGKEIGERAEEIVANIKEGIKKYNKTSGNKYEIHASIGCYTNHIKDRTMDDFLIKVDNLMYARKAMHKKYGDI